jgi:hypothetical protein
MDGNVARTHTSLDILIALLGQLRRDGTLTDQDVQDIVSNAPNLVGMINPNLEDDTGHISPLGCPQQRSGVALTARPLSALPRTIIGDAHVAMRTSF